MDSGQDSHRGAWYVADRVGATASFLCAIHCAVLPFALATLPFVGLAFLADHRFERIFVLFACALASVVLVRGFRRHRDPLPLRLAAAGVALLLLGIMWMDGAALVAHSVLVTCGGLLLASAHFVNLRIDRRAHAAHLAGACCTS